MLPVESRPIRLWGRVEPQPFHPQFGLRGALPALRPRPAPLSSPLPLSPGSQGSGKPGCCPFGPATLQTWAGLCFAARSLPSPLARCEAVTWMLNSQLRVIFLYDPLLGQSFPTAAAGSGLSLGPRRPHAGRERSGSGEGKWVCARRRVSGSNSTWLPSARASSARGCSLPVHASFLIIIKKSFIFGVRVLEEEGARLAAPNP